MATTSLPEIDIASGTYKELRVDTLKIDPSYQRTIREDTVNKIVKGLDPRLLGALYVSHRDNGDDVVLDGQQRREGLIRIGYGDQLVDCIVFYGLTVAEEAALFLGYNGPRTKPRPYDMFKAAVVAEDPAAIDIQRIVDKVGLTLGEGQGRARIQSVAAVRRIYEQGGPKVLERALTIAVRAWGGANKKDALSGDVLVAIAVFIARHNPDDARLVRVLMGDKGEPHALVKYGRMRLAEYRSVGGASTPVAGLVAGQMVGLYNKGLAAANKVKWDADATSHAFWRSASAPPSDRKQRAERVQRATAAGNYTNDAVLAKAYALRADGARWGEVHHLIEKSSPEYAALEASQETSRQLVIDYAKRTGKSLEAISGHLAKSRQKVSARARR